MDKTGLIDEAKKLVKWLMYRIQNLKLVQLY